MQSNKCEIMVKTAKKGINLVWFLSLMAYQPSWVILMPKPHSTTIQHMAEEDKGCYTFSKGH